MQNPTNRNYSASLETPAKNMLVAYLFWWFLGFVGAHRFYLDRPGSAILMIVLFVLGFFTFFITWIIEGIWWLIDGFFVYKIVTETNAQTGQPSLGFSLNTTSSNNLGATQGDLDLLEKAHMMHQKGILSDKEYLRKKGEVLGNDPIESLDTSIPKKTSLAGQSNKIEAIKQLADLKTVGALTEEEFLIEKRKILDN